MTNQTGQREVTVGRITVRADGGIIGPRVYIETDRFRALCARLERGDSAIFREGVRQGCETLALIATCIQTDLAAWIGEQEMLLSR